MLRDLLSGYELGELHGILYLLPNELEERLLTVHQTPKLVEDKVVIEDFLLSFPVQSNGIFDLGRVYVVDVKFSRIPDEKSDYFRVYSSLIL